MSTLTLTVEAIRKALSPPRLATYETAMSQHERSDPQAALALYAWNAEISGTLLFSLHVCEATIRNAVAEALEAIYGERWPWNEAFARTLKPISRAGLERSRGNLTLTSKVIPELKFSFWQQMFTRRHDERLWNGYLRQVLPNHDPQSTISALREQIYADLEQIRTLRNRIAHHEPIFKRNLLQDYLIIRQSIDRRCPFTAEWMERNQRVTAVLPLRPAP